MTDPRPVGAPTRTEPDTGDLARSRPVGRSITRRRLLGGAALGLLAGGGSAGWLYAREPPTPWYVTGGPENVRRSYAYAVAHPEVLRHIPCYCGCGKRDGHGSVLDCFVAGRDLFDRPRYDDHGVGCPICLAVVVDAERHIAAGKSLTETRAEIDAFYAPYASYATETDHPGDHGG